jgi:hypothetical protein
MATQKTHKPKRRLKLNSVRIASPRRPAASRTAANGHSAILEPTSRPLRVHPAGVDPWLVCLILSKASVAFKDIQAAG